MPYTPFFLLVTSCISMVHLSPLMDRYWYIIINKSVHCIPVSLVFTSQCLISIPRVAVITVSIHVSLSSSWLWQVLGLCFWCSWQLWGVSTGQVFYRMTLILDPSEVSLMIRLGLWAFGMKITEVKWYSHDVISRACTINMTQHC